MKNLAKCSGVLALFGALVVAPAAFADDPAQPSTEPKPAESTPAGATLGETLTGMAKADYVAARVLYQDGDYASALVKFESAFAASKNPLLLWNMAVCEKSLRHYAKMLGLLERYRVEARDKLTEADVKEVDGLVESVKALVSPLDLTTNEAGAEVLVDGLSLGATPLAKKPLIDVGEHTITLKKKGFREKTERVKVAGGAPLVLAWPLEREVHEGTISVHAAPGDAIFVDGKAVGTGAYVGKVSSGGHTLRVTAKGFRAHTGEVLVQDGETRRVDVTLEKEASGIPAWVWVAGGVVLASGAAVGGYFIFKPGEAQPQVIGTMDPGTVQAPLLR